MKKLTIDGVADIAEAVALCFEIRWSETEALVAADGHSGLNLFPEQGADFMILNLGLPDMDGLDVCRELRAQSDVPIVILMVRDGPNDIVRGLECGADDYITKPFDQMELLARALGTAPWGQAGATGATAVRWRAALDRFRRPGDPDGRKFGPA